MATSGDFHMATDNSSRRRRARRSQRLSTFSPMRSLDVLAEWRSISTAQSFGPARGWRALEAGACECGPQLAPGVSSKNLATGHFSPRANL